MDGMVAIGAGIAIGLTGFATAYAQSHIGAAAVGAIAEKPEMYGRLLLLVVLSETILMMGFVVALRITGLI